MFQFKPVTIAGLRFKQVEYHRNGVSGTGFFCAVAHDKRYGDMLITYFPEGDGICCAVYKLELLPDITFGVNSWRGDDYVSQMIKAIDEYWHQWNELYKVEA